MISRNIKNKKENKEKKMSKQVIRDEKGRRKFGTLDKVSYAAGEFFLQGY